jgi:hypothetical protein
MDEHRTREILDEARAHMRGDELVTKRNKQDGLVRKVTVTKRAEPDRVERHVVYDNTADDDPWAGWNRWLSDGVETRIEAERDFHREILSRALAHALDTAAKECRDHVATEMRITNARIDTVRDSVGALLQREHGAVAGLHKQLTDLAVENSELRHELSRLSKAVTPLLEHFRDLLRR